MASIEKALQIAAGAHEGQKDKDGQPYILHPLRVMNAVEDEPAKVVAVLHDVIEDTSVTAEELRREGFDEAVLAAVECLTYRKGEPYADYVVRCKGDEIARRVKLADLEDNARPSRALLRPDRIEPHPTVLGIHATAWVRALPHHRHLPSRSPHRHHR